MNKKSIISFIIIFILIILFFAIFTDLFEINPSSLQSDITYIEGAHYDYVKSRDTSKKTKIKYPVFNDFNIIDYQSDDYIKSYISDNKQMIMAIIDKTSTSIEKYEESQYNIFRGPHELQGNKVTSENVNCQYLCKKYKVYKSDNSLYIDEFRIYIKTSMIDAFTLIYNSENQELSNTLISILKDNIKISNDAIYKIGYDGDGKLIINMDIRNNKYVYLPLNDAYEELIDENNSQQSTLLHNIKTDNKVRISIKYKRGNYSLYDDISSFFGVDKNKIKKITIGDIVFYEYNLGNKFAYAYIINEDNALIIEPTKKDFNIRDFRNVRVIDDTTDE